MLRRDPDGCTLSITTVLLRRGLHLNHGQYLYITNREIQEAPLRVSHLQSYGGKINVSSSGLRPARNQLRLRSLSTPRIPTRKLLFLRSLAHGRGRQTTIFCLIRLSIPHKALVCYIIRILIHVLQLALHSRRGEPNIPTPIPISCRNLAPALLRVLIFLFIDVAGWKWTDRCQ
jgi:hypothetical protein